MMFKARKKSEAEKAITMLYGKDRVAQVMNGYKAAAQDSSTEQQANWLVAVTGKVVTDAATANLGRSQVVSAWIPPPSGMFKVNSDAAILGDDGASVGVVIRDDYGFIVAACVKKYEQCWDVAMAEAMGVLFWLHLASSLGLPRTNFCFICSHLASREKEGDELRSNSDVIEILKNTQFPKICNVNRMP
ncbi:hypothetical protein V2J09_004719 [Rumex salicifolius]